MKVTGELVGITQNACARERFLLTAPERSGLAEEAHVMAGFLNVPENKHHDLSLAVWTLDKTRRERYSTEEYALILHESYDV